MGGRTLFGVGGIQFYSSTDETRALSGLNRERFLALTQANLSDFETPRPEATGGNLITINGASAPGTSQGDLFTVLAGRNLSLDAGAGIDALLASPQGAGAISLAYDSGNNEVQLGGEALSVTGTFRAFENAHLTFDEGDQDLTLNGRGWRITDLDLGTGFDKVTLGRTNVAFGRVYVDTLADGRLRVRSDYDGFGDLTLRGVEHLSTTAGESNLYIPALAATTLTTLTGGRDSENDTLTLQSADAPVFLREENEVWYFGLFGQARPVQLREWERLDIEATLIYTPDLERVSTLVNGRTLYGVGGLRFFSQGAELRTLEGLDPTLFLELKDSDGDGAFDLEDPYDDNDGVPDAEEAALGSDPLQADSDQDGLDDALELVLGTNLLGSDSDGDGLDDKAEREQGLDPTRAHSDGDGLLDGAELAAGLNPLAAGSDGDSVPDGEEVALGLDPLIEDCPLDRCPTGMPIWLLYYLSELLPAQNASP